MLNGEIFRQRLKIANTHVVADTIDYLEAKFIFRTDDWDGLDKWVHFAKDSAVYDIRLTDNCIRKEDHLNLSAGMWKVYLHGNEFRDGKVIQRITTDEAVLYVLPTGTLDGEPFPEMPASVTEQILARLDNVEQNGGGGGGIAQETDPTVPAWAKQPEKPTYTAEEVGALPASTKIPKKTSEITNDSGFIDKTVADLVNYYTKSQTYTQAEINALVSAIPKFAIAVVPTLPTSNISTTTVYLVKSGTSGDLYTEYIYVNGAWEILGNQRVDLTGYATEAWVNTKLSDYLPAAQLTAAINTALAQAKESGEFDGEPGKNGITPHIGDNGNWYVGETDTGIPAQGKDGQDYILTEADKEEIAGMIPGGGSGESDIFNVTLTTNEDGTITASHTSQEIYAAAQEGKVITSLTVSDGFVQSCVPALITADFVAFYNVFAADTSDYDVSVTMVGIAGSDVLIQTATIDKMTGASANSDGTVGLVPQPLTGQQDYILHGDGAWRKPAETISNTSANTEIPSAKAVYDAIQTALTDSGDSSGSSAGVVIFKVAYIDGTVMLAEYPAVYPEGADMQTLLAAGQARMLVIEPSDSENVFAKKLGILGAAYVEETVIQFAGTITGENGNEAVMAKLDRETYEITITPLVQNSAGPGGGGGVVTITDNGDGTYNSSHTPAEIAAMAETGAVVAAGAGAIIPLFQVSADNAVFSLFMIEDDTVGQGAFVVTNDGVSFEVISYYVGEMHGADTTNSGTGGTVPAPAAGQQDYVLHGDGTWRAALSEDDKTDLVHRVIEKLPTWEGGTY